MGLTIRDAGAADADLLAWTQVEAARSSTPLGFWDLAFPGTDDARLARRAGHRAHVDGPLIAP